MTLAIVVIDTGIVFVKFLFLFIQKGSRILVLSQIMLLKCC